MTLNQGSLNRGVTDMVKVVEKKGLQDFLTKLSQDYILVGPVLNKENKKIEYQYLDDINELNLDKQPDRSPKGFFLPQQERLGNDFQAKAELKDKEKKTIILGVRSCDLEALKVLDDVFLDQSPTGVDAYYKEKWENTIIIGLSCENKEKSCFCTALGVNPVENDKAPIYMYQTGDKYILKAENPKYEQLINSLADGEDKELEELINEREKSFQEDSFNLDLPIPLPEKEIFKAPVWSSISEKCLGCGICTFYCPTCYCFGFFWEKSEGQVDKWRKWDSCMFSLYSKHASGHNPREKNEQRYRQRVMHKYSYHPENYGRLACTGCGRCLNNCPVNLDLRQALKSLESYLKEEGGDND